MKALKNGLRIDYDSDEDIIELSPEAIQEIEALDERLAKMKDEDSKWGAINGK